MIFLSLLARLSVDVTFSVVTYFRVFREFWWAEAAVYRLKNYTRELLCPYESKLLLIDDH